VAVAVFCYVYMTSDVCDASEITFSALLLLVVCQEEHLAP